MPTAVARHVAATAATTAMLCLLPRLSTAAAPTGLLTDLKRSPSLGVRGAPSFGWIVPACGDSSDHVQTAYQINVTSSSTVVWDSGKVESNESTYVLYSGPALKPGTPYQWTVTTWTASTSGSSCQSSPSDPASFITELFNGFSNSTEVHWVQVGNGKSTFAYFRKEFDIPAGIVSAQAFITAPLATPLLSAYKLYIGGKLVNIGPGRGEAPVWGGDGQFRSLPYTTLDVSPFLSTPGQTAVAIEGMTSQVLLQLQLVTSDGSITTTGTDESWMGFDADIHRRPAKSIHGGSAGTGFVEYIDARAEPIGWKETGAKLGSSWAPVTLSTNVPSPQELHARMEPPMEVGLIPTVYFGPTPPQGPPGPVPPGPPGPPSPPSMCVLASENRIANVGCQGGSIVGVEFASFGTPTGSCTQGFQIDPKCNSNHSIETITKACVGKTSCQIPATCAEFDEPLTGSKAFCWDVKKSLAVQVKCNGSASTISPRVDRLKNILSKSDPNNTTTLYGDFGREFQGGLILTVGDGKAGQNVTIACGEAISNGVIQADWGWEFTWTLRDGPQVLEQHKYMECRFVSLVFDGLPPSNVTLSAWKTHYPYYPEDTSFTSSNSTLNAVWELCRYTLEGASLDTYTDSNTRERRPYEADGIIAATGRLMIQRDFMWPRHSHAWVIQNPTWPVEWQQTSPFLGWQDYMATGQPDLALAFLEPMYTRTKIEYLDNTGLLDTSKMGRHIVDWMPNGAERDETVALGEFTASDHTSVSNAFAAHGLELLATMVAAGGRLSNASAFAVAAKSLKEQIVKQMWNGTNFCDGPCSDVHGNSLVMTNIFMLCFGMVPEANVNDAWQIVADWGIENIGDYGAFWYQMALSSGYYAPNYATPDDGTAILTALTKCDTDSWCSELELNNETMTRESWHDGTYSHEWGTSAIVGVVWGLMGIHQTAPGYAAFTVKPKLGTLQHAAITVPTIRGYINVTASPDAVSVNVPCNTAALLCFPRASSDDVLLTPTSHRLLIDGIEVDAVSDGGHLCASAPVGCGANGVARLLTSRRR